MTERQIEEIALQRLNEIIPKDSGWKLTPAPPSRKDRPDFAVTLRRGKERVQLVAECKASAEPAQARIAIAQLRMYALEHPSSALVLIVPYLSPRAAQLCAESGVHYLDLSGNCRLALGSLYIERVGFPNKFPAKRGLRTAFSPKASRIVRALLYEPERKWKQSDLAKEMGVSIGMVHKTLRLLEEYDLVDRDESGRIVLAAPGDLLDQWRDDYAKRRQSWETYFCEENDASALMRLAANAARARKHNLVFTNQAGASLVAPFGTFHRVHAYLDENPEAIVKSLSLRPAVEGNLALAESQDPSVMSGARTVNGIPIVHPIQIYLDLWQSGGRGREEATFLREQDIGF